MKCPHKLHVESTKFPPMGCSFSVKYVGAVMTGEAVCQTQAVSFATERMGWLHRKTQQQTEKLFSTPVNSTALCWSFCFAFLCFFSLFLFSFFSMLWLTFSCSGTCEKTVCLPGLPLRFNIYHTGGQVLFS